MSWFWTPRTHLPYYDYMLSHLCLIAEDLNPDAKYIWVDVETGVKWPAMTGRSCRVDLNDSNNGPVAASVDLTLGSEVVQRVFQDQPSRFYADVYDLFKRQSNKVAGQKPNLTAKSP